MSIEPNKVTYSISEQQQRRAFVHYYWVQIRSWIPWIILLLIVINLQAYWAGTGDPSQPHYSLHEMTSASSAAIVAMAMWIAVMGLGYAQKNKNLYRLSPEQFQNISWEPMDDGLLIVDCYSNSKYPWKKFSGVHLSRDFLILRRKDIVLIHFCPRSSFTDGGKVWYDTFKDKIQKHKS